MGSRARLAALVGLAPAFALSGCASLFGFEPGRGIGDGVDDPAAGDADVAPDEGGGGTSQDGGDGVTPADADASTLEAGAPTAPPCIRSTIAFYFCDDLDDREVVERGDVTMAAGVFSLAEGRGRSVPNALRVAPRENLRHDDGLAWRPFYTRANRLVVSLAVLPEASSATSPVTLVAVLGEARSELFVTLTPRAGALDVGLGGSGSLAHPARLEVGVYGEVALRLDGNDVALEVNGVVARTRTSVVFVSGDVGWGLGDGAGRVAVIDDVTVDGR